MDKYIVASYFTHQGRPSVFQSPGLLPCLPTSRNALAVSYAIQAKQIWDIEWLNESSPRAVVLDIAHPSDE